MRASSLALMPAPTLLPHLTIHLRAGKSMYTISLGASSCSFPRFTKSQTSTRRRVQRGAVTSSDPAGATSPESSTTIGIQGLGAAAWASWRAIPDYIAPIALLYVAFDKYRDIGDIKKGQHKLKEGQHRLEERQHKLEERQKEFQESISKSFNSLEKSMSDGFRSSEKSFYEMSLSFDRKTLGSQKEVEMKYFWLSHAFTAGVTLACCKNK